MAPSVKLETISPRKASQLLKANSTNRKIRKGHVQMLVEAINDNEWEVTGETIKVNCNGDLIDGQHRLTAIAQSGKSVKTYVARGVPVTVRNKIDGGRPRTLGDHLTMTGEKHASTLASAVRMFVEFKAGDFRLRVRKNVRRTSVDEFLRNHGDIRDSVVFVSQRKGNKVFHPGYMAAMHYLLSSIDSDAADEFFHGILTMEDLRSHAPQYHVARTLQDFRASPHKTLNLDGFIYMIVAAWNKYRSRSRMQSARSLLKKSGQSLPAISGFESSQWSK